MQFCGYTLLKLDVVSLNTKPNEKKNSSNFLKGGFPEKKELRYVGGLG